MIAFIQHFFLSSLVDLSGICIVLAVLYGVIQYRAVVIQKYAHEHNERLLKIRTDIYNEYEKVFFLE